MVKEAIQVKGGIPDEVKATLTSDVNVGDVVPYGTEHIGIATVSALAGEAISLFVSGEWEIAAANADAIGEGDILYFDTTNRVLTKTATNNVKAGVATSGKPASMDGKVTVKINW